MKKNTKPSERARLLHIQDAIRRASAFTEGNDFDSFQADDKTFAATVRQIEIIGEAARTLSEETKRLDESIAWKEIVKTRHILAHDYYDVSASVTWRIVSLRLPELAPKIEALIEKLEAEEDDAE